MGFDWQRVVSQGHLFGHGYGPSGGRVRGYFPFLKKRKTVRCVGDLRSPVKCIINGHSRLGSGALRPASRLELGRAIVGTT
jgi:hypothetical protein